MKSDAFSNMVQSRHTRQKFLSHLMLFLREHNFDGVDLDWEFPADRGGIDEDKPNFTIFINELREAVDNEFKINYKLYNNRFIISAAVAAGRTRINNGYNVRNMSRDLDFINLMT
jgi:chitinase